MSMSARVGLVIAGLAGSLVSACRGGEPPAPPPPPPRALAPAPAVPAAPPDLTLATGLVMSPPIVDERVTLVPVIATAPRADANRYALLTDAMDRGTAVVRELEPDWVVETLDVHNRSLVPVLAMRGEMMLDGNQDRVIGENKIIQPGEHGTLTVRCVEAEREHGRSTRFRAGGMIAELPLRRTVRFADQHAVWQMVDKLNDKLGLSPSTKTYRTAAARQTEGAIRVQRDRVLAALAQVPKRDAMVGVAVAIDGKLIALEHFASPALYRAAEPRLIASYLAIVDDPASSTYARGVTPADVRDLAAWPGAADSTEVSTEILRPIDTTPQD